MKYYSFIGYLRLRCWKDPTSQFFQAERAHVPNYSTYRIQEAEVYADSIATGQQPPSSTRSGPPELCIGVASVERKGISYLKSTLGSLQHGLSAEERARLYFVVLLAHTNQADHIAYGQPWLASMTDKLPSYSDNAERFALANIMESNQTHGTKAKFDYSIVMGECEKTGASGILMIEDDVVFMDGWWPRVREALAVATTKTWELGHKDFLYLRLFYYEGLLGWNSESWPTYLASSLIVMTGVLGVLLLLRRYIPTTRLYLTRSAILLATFVFTPFMIILYFAGGANCLHPRPSGVHLMSENACCGQGLVFQRSTVTDELLPLFHNNRWSEVPTDSFLEQHADASRALRWALTPVVMQHIGGQSSHGVNRGGGMTPNHLWNYGFEDYDAGSLAREHVL
ncbi:hypothetical protein E0Z10_g7526 [Xylaria hypoxylon]|uniref:Integral membrane protein n=1 Tax=Xylaria hypoxylon TaxID=37992 RepID=A0A4Z0YAJ8_9PEZI|nr:hypothetical protein E0Z10_g7526 [Xylaria hypoxylon]